MVRESDTDLEYHKKQMRVSTEMLGGLSAGGSFTRRIFYQKLNISGDLFPINVHFLSRVVYYQEIVSMESRLSLMLLLFLYLFPVCFSL